MTAKRNKAELGRCHGAAEGERCGTWSVSYSLVVIPRLLEMG